MYTGIKTNKYAAKPSGGQAGYVLSEMDLTFPVKALCQKWERKKIIKNKNM